MRIIGSDGPSEAQPAVEHDEHVCQRKCYEDSVESVQNAAVTGKQRSRILHPGVSLEDGLGEVAELPDEPDERARFPPPLNGESAKRRAMSASNAPKMAPHEDSPERDLATAPHRLSSSDSQREEACFLPQRAPAKKAALSPNQVATRGKMKEEPSRATARLPARDSPPKPPGGDGSGARRPACLHIDHAGDRHGRGRPEAALPSGPRCERPTTPARRERRATISAHPTAASHGPHGVVSPHASTSEPRNLRSRGPVEGAAFAPPPPSDVAPARSLRPAFRHGHRARTGPSSGHDAPR
jgi:hypothetical protein